MSQSSPILSLPYIQPSQAQKHVTHNEALRILDAVTQLTVISATLGTPPSSPGAGDRYIVAAGPTDEWTDQQGKIAIWFDSTWQFFEGQVGWRADVIGTGEELRFDGVGWQTVQPDLQDVPLVGINAAADVTNRLTVSANATLLNNAGSGHQLKLNKSSDVDTASLLFQTGFSGRAEMGTAGNDNFSIKVSADGNVFSTAFSADAATGAVQFPSGQHFFHDVEIGNDSAWSVDIPWSDPARILLWLAVDIQGYGFLTAVTGSAAGAANFSEVFAGQASTLNYASGPLSGTTGPAGGVSISIDATGPTSQLCLENRLGTTQTFTLATLGR